ncbi:MAG: NAD-dependent epimerase/dehydratase family protein [Gemmatimonadota bacterium]
MRVFVAGGTGVIGRRVVESLVREGHEVTALARTDDTEQTLRTLGARPDRSDLFDQAALERAVRGHDVVVNLATAIPPASEAMSEQAWARNHRVRREGAANLSEAALRGGVRRFVQESIALLYADGGDEWLDEEAPVSTTWVTESSLDAESAALAFGKSDREAVVLRFATFHAPDSAHTVDTIGAARQGVAACLGPLSSFLSTIHADDAASAVVAALSVQSGVYNVADDEPLRRADYFAALERAVGENRLSFPEDLDHGLEGTMLEMVLRSQRVSNRKLREHSTWRPEHPTASETWRAIITESALLPA